jgi:hypothetical protein
LFLIENCIFGVDIQPIAVQIAKLRFFISLIVDQKVNDSQLNRGILPLPNLETKFVAANSLIGVETQLTLRSPEVITKEAELKKVRQQHFTARTPKTKKKCREKDEVLRQEISELLKSTGLETAVADTLARWNPYDLNASSDFFDPEWMFGVSSFDICIGNLPYVFARNSQQKGISQSDKDYYYNHYTLSEYQVNLYPLFIEKGTQVLNEGGILSYITPNNWLTINTNKNLREFILNKQFIKIINFYAKIFESAAVDSSIVIFVNIKDNKEIQILEYVDSFHSIYTGKSKFFFSQKDYLINIDILRNVDAIHLVSKIEEKSIILDKLASVKVGLGAYGLNRGEPPQTKEMIANRVYHAKTKLTEQHIKYLEGKDVCRYYLGWSGEYLKYGKHLREPRADFNLFCTKRILVRQIPSKFPHCINACLTEELALNDRNSMNVLYFKESPKFLLGILNCKLISYWFVQKFGKLQRETFPQFKRNELAIFPFPKITNILLEKERIIVLVNQILEIKRQNPQADTSDLEREIDEIVYQLYGLTEEEIAIIEEATQRK